MKAAPLALALCGCGGDPLDRLAEGERGRVDALFAGGRLRLEDGTAVRLAGLETPGRDEPGGAEAQALLTRMLDGRSVALLYGGPRRDGFGRAIAQVRTAGARRWVQGALLDAGLARVRTTADDRALAAEMLRREAAARDQRRGAWSTPEWRVRLPGEVQPGFILAEGRVGAVEQTRLGPRLSFEASGLVIDIDRRAASDLRAAGTPVGAVVGRLLRVRGVARRRVGGHVLRIDHPEQIEVLREIKPVLNLRRQGESPDSRAP